MSESGQLSASSLTTDADLDVDNQEGLRSLVRGRKHRRHRAERCLPLPQKRPLYPFLRVPRPLLDSATVPDERGGGRDLRRLPRRPCIGHELRL